MKSTLRRRTLPLRISEQERGVFRVVAENGKNYSKWKLRENGKGMPHIPLAIMRFWAKGHAGEVLEDCNPRGFNEVFLESYLSEIMKDYHN